MDQWLTEAGWAGGATEFYLQGACVCRAEKQALSCTMPGADFDAAILVHDQGRLAKRQQHPMADHPESEQQKQGIELSIKLE